jgi:hypothetical protein
MPQRLLFLFVSGGGENDDSCLKFVAVLAEWREGSTIYILLKYEYFVNRSLPLHLWLTSSTTAVAQMLSFLHVNFYYFAAPLKIASVIKCRLTIVLRCGK